MRARDISKAVVSMYKMRRPGFIWGPPGIGKTDVIEDAGGEIKDYLVATRAMKASQPFTVMDFRVALRDPTDLKGYPMADIAGGVMRYLHDEQLPRDGHGILFFDEMNNGMPAVQACAMQLTLAGRIGTYELPEGWSVMASGNRETDRGVTYSMPTPLMNRFTHLEMEVNHEDWIDWAMRNDISPTMIAFHRWKTDQLFTFDPKSGSKAFGTPRSWVAADKISSDDSLEDHIKYAMVKGTVGDGEGIGYEAFCRLQSQLFTIDQILATPDRLKMPDDPSILWTLCTMVATHVTPKNFDTITKFTGEMPMEYQAVFIRDVLTRQPDIKSSTNFQKWALKNNQILI